MSENIHDKGYKQILSKKKNFLTMIKKYVKSQWMETIEEDDLELIDKEFIPKDMKEKEADIIYRIKLKEGEVIIYTLLELQSKVDFTMPFRLLIYMTEVLKRIFADTPKKERERSDYKLPAIIPIVLYNGKYKWTAKRRFAEYTKGYKEVEENIIDFRYIMIDINEKDEEYIMQTNTIIDNIFALDRNLDKDKLKRTMRIVGKRYKELTYEEQIEIVNWTKNVLFKKVGKDKLAEELIKAMKKGDEENMEYAIERLFDEEKEKARKEGRKEGREEERRNVAKELLDNGTEIEFVQRITKLPMNELRKIKEGSELY